jgi:hypothetical protein
MKNQDFAVLKDSVYRRVSSNSLYESVFERMIFNFSSQLFPDYFCFDFKSTLIVPRETNVKADLILVDKFYTEWILVEVELSDHSWEHHVYDQIQRFELMEIDQETCSRLSTANPQLDAQRIHSLLKSQRPRILIVCDSRPPWHEALTTTSAELLIASPYRNEDNHLLLQVSREVRRRRRTVLSGIQTAGATMPSCYKILSPHALELREQDVLVQSSDGSVGGKLRLIGQYWYLVFASGAVLEDAGRCFIIGFANGIIEIDGKVSYGYESAT